MLHAELPPRQRLPSLAVIIPALNAARHLPACLAKLEEGRRSGLVKAVIVVDGGSADGTIALAAAAGAQGMSAPRGRGTQLAAGADHALSSPEPPDWLLFLHADTRLAPGWSAAAAAHMAQQSARVGGAGAAGFFRFALDDDSPPARRLEAMVAWRCRALRLPYGDQGLLIAAAVYRAIGGFRPLPLMEDVDLVRRLLRRFGRTALVPLPVAAVTSADRFRRDGYLRRSARNLGCLSLWLMGVPATRIARLYGR